MLKSIFARILAIVICKPNLNSNTNRQLFGEGHSEQNIRLYRTTQSEALLSGVPCTEYRYYPEPGFV